MIPSLKDGGGAGQKKQKQILSHKRFERTQTGRAKFNTTHRPALERQPTADTGPLALKSHATDFPWTTVTEDGQRTNTLEGTSKHGHKKTHRDLIRCAFNAIHRRTSTTTLRLPPRRELSILFPEKEVHCQRLHPPPISMPMSIPNATQNPNRLRLDTLPP